MNINMPTVVKYGTAIVLLHAFVTIVHGAAHVGESVFGSALDNIFIVGVIWLAPLAAIWLLRMRRWQAGSLLVLLAMAASLVYGVYNHFVLPGPDNVVSFPIGFWQVYFRITAILLVLIESVGTVVGAILMWLSLTRKTQIA